MRGMFAKIVQHRVALLVGALVFALILAALMQMESLLVAEVCAALLGVLLLGLFVATLIELNARYPATFLVREGSFTTPPDAGTVLSTAGLTVMPVANIGFLAAEMHPGFGVRLDRLEIVSLVLIVLIAALLWYRVLGPFGPVLRPDGLLDRQPFGSMFVPWEAGPRAQPALQGVKLLIARPDLVQRRGFRPGTSIRTGADRGFTAWAINLYAARPEYRPTIGTDEGLHLLQPR